MAEWDEDARGLLRAAAFRRDGRGGLEVLAGRPLEPVLQYAGDVLIAALGEGRPGAERLARECADALSRRAGPGDAELAAELDAALQGTTTPLVEIPVDLGALGARLDADPAEGVQMFDLRTGDIDEPGDGDDGDDRGRWLAFVPGGPDPDDPGEEAQRGRARRWLAEHGYRPGPRPFL